MSLSISSLTGMKKRSKTIEILRESNREIEKILDTLKVSQTEVVNLGKPPKYLFEELISELLIVLLPQDLYKFDLEIKLPGLGIFFSILTNPLSKKEEGTNECHPEFTGQGQGNHGNPPNPTFSQMHAII